MAGVFGEAIAAVTASCNLGVVVVALAAVAAGFGNVRVVAAVVVAAIVGGWLFAANVSVPLARTGGTVVHAIALAILIAGVFAARKQIWLAAGIAAVAELLATAWWRPCVGSELADIINRGSDAFGSVAAGMAVYMVGLLTPAIALSSIIYLVSGWSPRRPQVPNSP